MRRRIRIPAVGRVEVVADPDPGAPGPDEALLQTEFAGICGSDVHVLSGRHPFVAPPVDPGHEVVGIVAAVGAGVGALPVGTRVVLDPLLACGHCAACRKDRPMRCSDGIVLGFGLPGGMADRVRVAADQLVPVPDGLTPEIAVFAEPLATAVRAVDQAGSAASVLVLGGGTIGLLVALWARQAGAGHVAVSEPVASKRRLAVDLGLDAHPPDALPEDLVDVVLDCVAVPATVAQAVSRIRSGGTLVVVGVPAGDVDVPLAVLQRREVVLRGSSLYGRGELQRALAALAMGAVPAGRLRGSVHPMTHAAGAFAAAREPGALKTLISFP